MSLTSEFSDQDFSFTVFWLLYEINCYFDGNSFIQVRKFRESRKKNTDEEDEEVLQVSFLNFEHRLKNGMVTSAYVWSHLAILQHCPCQKVPVCLGKISKSFWNLPWYNMYLSYCSIWLWRSLFLCELGNLDAQLFSLKSRQTRHVPLRGLSSETVCDPTTSGCVDGCIEWCYWNKLVL